MRPFLALLLALQSVACVAIVPGDDDMGLPNQRKAARPPVPPSVFGGPPTEQQPAPSIWGAAAVLSPIASGGVARQGILRVSNSDVGHATQLTVMLGLDPLNTSYLDIPGGDIYAVLSWGVGGARFTAEVDIGMGTQVELTADHVDISAVYDPQLINGSVPIQVSVGVRRGSRGVGSSAPTRTIARAHVAQNADASFPRPNFADRVVIGGTGDASTIYRVQFRQTIGVGGAVTFNSWLAEQNANTVVEYPLSGTEYDLLVRPHAGAVAVDSIVAVYKLAL